MIYQSCNNCNHACHICSHYCCPLRRDADKIIIDNVKERFDYHFALALKRIRNDCAYCMKRAMTNTPSITLVVTHGLRYWIKSWGYFIKKRRMIKKRCHKCTEFQKCNIKYDIWMAIQYITFAWRAHCTDISVQYLPSLTNSPWKIWGCQSPGCGHTV